MRRGSRAPSTASRSPAYRGCSSSTRRDRPSAGTSRAASMTSSCSRPPSAPTTTSRANTATSTPVDAGALRRGEPDRGDPVQRRPAAPDRAAQQPGRLGDQRVTQVREDDVLLVRLGDGRVEGQRARLPGQRVGQPGHRALPPGPQVRRRDQPGRAGPFHVGQRRLAGQRQRGVHHPADVRRGDVQRADAGVQLLAQPADLLAQISLGAQRRRGRLGATVSGSTRTGRPSIRASTAWARTGLTLPRSLRSTAIFWATRDRYSRSPS